jgi:hypothetical protein
MATYIVSAKEGKKGPDDQSGPLQRRKLSGFSSCDGSFLVSFYACAWQFCDAFFFYHKA